MQILILKSSTLPFHYFVVIPMSMDILQSNFATRQRSIGSSKWIILISRNYGNQKYEKMVPIESKVADLSNFLHFDFKAIDFFRFVLRNCLMISINLSMLMTLLDNFQNLIRQEILQIICWHKSAFLT